MNIYMQRKSKKIYFSKIILYGVFLFLMVVLILNKVNFHVDETFSYGLANHQGGNVIGIEDGKLYTPAEEPFLNYLTVSNEHAFDYGNVWKNQSNDVHPPLYYALLHTICSFFPGSFNKWYAGSINIVFAVLTLFFLRRLLMRLTNSDEKIRDIISIIFILSSGILSAVSFFRMYIMAMFFVTALTELLARKIGEWDFNLKFFVQVGLIAVLGALTHYYCIVFTFLVCATFCIILLINKFVSPVLKLILTGIISGIIAYSIFPYMLYHMFSGNRGKEATENLNQPVNEFWNRIKDFFDIISNQIFGGVLSYILIALILIVILNYILKERGQFDNNHIKILSYFCSDEKIGKIILMRYCLIIVPIILYFLLVAKMAAYITDRYMFPIYAISIGVVFSLVITGIKKIFKGKKAVTIMAVFMAIILFNGFKNINWPYLYRSSSSLIESSKEKADVDCLFIYDSNWKAQASFLEVRNYNSVTFVKSGNLKILSNLEIAEKKQLIVLITLDDEQVLKTIMEIYPQFDTYTEVGTYSNARTYYLSSE